MLEMIFLPLANHLPRMLVFDFVRYLFYKLAGIHIEGRCIIYGPLIIRPIGCAKNISIGKGTFLNTEIRFGCPKDRIMIGLRPLGCRPHAAALRAFVSALPAGGGELIHHL